MAWRLHNRQHKTVRFSIVVVVAIKNACRRCDLLQKASEFAAVGVAVRLVSFVSFVCPVLCLASVSSVVNALRMAKS